MPWEDATIGGFAADRVLDEPARRRLDGRIAALWPPGPYALASAAAKVVEAMSGDSRRLVSCFVAPDDRGRRRTRTAALPVSAGPERRSSNASMLPRAERTDERVALDNAMLL